MANELIQNGYFGVKESFNVSAPDIATGWYAGQLFLVESHGTSGAGALQGAVTSMGTFVGLNATSGASIAGVAMENSSDVTTAVSGMQHPSGSKVTLLHGHSSFIIDFKGTATSAATRQSTGAPWEPGVESASLMDPLYASVNGKFTVMGTWSVLDIAADSPPPTQIGHIWQVPSSANSWKMGVVLYG